MMLRVFSRGGQRTDVSRVDRSAAPSRVTSGRSGRAMMSARTGVRVASLSSIA